MNNIDLGNTSGYYFFEEKIKTVQDLVDRLNNIDDSKDFSLTHRRDEYYLLGYKLNNLYFPLVGFDRDNREWDIRSDLSGLGYYSQKKIVDFLACPDWKEWLPERKYNIVIGNCTDGAKTYWKKDRNDFITFTTHDDESKSIDFMFTKTEIKKLKSTLPTNMAKIVDLGKVEVKDD